MADQGTLTAEMMSAWQGIWGICQPSDERPLQIFSGLQGCRSPTLSLREVSKFSIQGFQVSETCQDRSFGRMTFTVYGRF